MRKSRCPCYVTNSWRDLTFADSNVEHAAFLGNFESVLELGTGNFGTTMTVGVGSLNFSLELIKRTRLYETVGNANIVARFLSDICIATESVSRYVDDLLICPTRISLTVLQMASCHPLLRIRSKKRGYRIIYFHREHEYLMLVVDHLFSSLSLSLSISFDHQWCIIP